MNVTDKLSDHFTLGEMTRTSVRLPNDPPTSAIVKLKALCVNVLERVRSHFGLAVNVSSGYRSPAVNARVRGSDRSQHMKGEAADFEVGGLDHLTVARFIVENVVFDQLIIEFCTCDATPAAACPGWVHCSYVTDRPNRGSIKRAQNVRDERTGATRTQYATLTKDEIPQPCAH